MEHAPSLEKRGRQALADVGRGFHARGWALGTGGNFSVVLSRDPLRLLITASGKDKGRLRGDDDIVLVDGEGRRVRDGEPEPSAETLLHAVLARRPDVGAVLHTHSVWATILSDLHCDAGELELAGYEMLKGLAGVTTHEHRHRVKVFDNCQDMASLARLVEAGLRDGEGSLTHGFLLRGHGLYAWGRDLEEARRHVEVLEFLFEVVVRRRGLGGGA